MASRAVVWFTGETGVWGDAGVHPFLPFHSSEKCEEGHSILCVLRHASFAAIWSYLWLKQREVATLLVAHTKCEHGM